MISMYQHTILRYANEFSKIGLARTMRSDYSISFSGTSRTVEISTEQYYHPSLTSMLIDSTGRRYAIRLLKEIYSPDLAKRDLVRLCSIVERYNRPELSQGDRLELLQAYAETVLSGLLEFLRDKKSLLIDGVPTFDGEYSLREHELMAAVAKDASRPEHKGGT